MFKSFLISKAPAMLFLGNQLEKVCQALVLFGFLPPAPAFRRRLLGNPNHTDTARNIIKGDIEGEKLCKGINPLFERDSNGYCAQLLSNYR